MRCARRAATAAAHFIGGDPDDGPMPMDCFVWVCIRESRAIVVDTSFAMEVAAKRKSGWLRCPVESLRLLGLEPEAVEDVVLTHLHHDHVGSFHLFPKARFHLPKPEMHSAKGPLHTPRASGAFLRGRGWGGQCSDELRRAGALP